MNIKMNQKQLFSLKNNKKLLKGSEQNLKD